MAWSMWKSWSRMQRVPVALGGVICGGEQLNRDLVPLSFYYIFTKFKSLAFRQKKVHSNPINTDGDIPRGRFSCALGTVENFLLWSWSIEIKKKFCFKFQFWGQICLTIDHFRLIGAKKIFWSRFSQNSELSDGTENLYSTVPSHILPSNCD